MTGVQTCALPIFHRISQWSKIHGLLINPIKTQAIVIGSQRLLSRLSLVDLPQINVNGTSVTFSSTVKDLGLLIDQNLTWRPQVNEISRKLYSRSIHSLKRLQNFISLQTKVYLCQTLLLPILDYGDVCYPDLNEDLLTKLERLQNLCIRYIFGLRKFYDVSEFRSRLNWVGIRDRRNIHALTLLFNIIHNPNSPSYITSRFTFLSSHKMQLRSQNDSILMIPKHSSSFYGQSFTVTATRMWNELYREIRNSPSANVFKNCLKINHLT